MARVGLEHLTSNAYTAFPFAENATALIYNEPGVPFVWPATEPAYGESAWLPVDAFVDALVIAPEDNTAGYLYGFNAEVQSGNKYISVLLADQDLVPIESALFSLTSLSVNQAGWGTLYLDINDDYIFRAVYTQQLIHYLTEYADPVDSGYSLQYGTQGNLLPFEPCIIEPRPAKLRSLQLYSRNMTSKSSEIYSDIQFQAGYNVELTTADVEGDDIIELATAPGAGQGKVPCDIHQQSVDKLIGIEGLIPDAVGSVRVTGDDCYEVVTLPSAGIIQLESNCYACCSCDDYLSLAKALKRMIQRTNDLKAELENIHAEYSECLDHYHTTHIPKLRTVYTSAHFMRGYQHIEGLSTEGSHSHVALTTMNKGAEVAADMTITLNCSGTVLGGTLIRQIGGTTFQQFRSTAGEIFTGNLGAGDVVAAVFRVKLPDDYSDTDVGAAWTVDWKMYGEIITDSGSVAYS